VEPLTVLAQSPQGPDAIAGYLRLTAEAVLQSDLPLVRLPDVLRARDVPALLERLNGPGRVCYSGYLPHPGAYAALDYGLRSRGLELLNSPRAMRLSMDFEHWYPSVSDLTAQSIVLHDARDVPAAVALGLPLFVKGTVKSRKEQGLEACLARDEAALRSLLEEAAGNRLVARELLPLRQSGETRMGFHVSREYRVYFYAGQELGHGYYWGLKDPDPLTRSERAEMLELAGEAARRLAVPLLAVDVAQLETGEWRLIEVGDPQFSGVAHMPRHLYWRRLQELL
jgi:hypothetical protein